MSMYIATPILERTAILLLRFQESRTRMVLSCRRQHRRVGQAYQGYRTMSHLCSYPPGKTKSTLGITPALV